MASVKYIEPYCLLVASAGAGVLGIPLLRETYAPILRLRRARSEGKLDEFSRNIRNLSQAVLGRKRLP